MEGIIRRSLELGLIVVSLRLVRGWVGGGALSAAGVAAPATESRTGPRARRGSRPADRIYTARR